MPTDRQFFGFALATVILGAALLALAIYALREPRAIFPLVPRSAAHIAP